MSFVLKAATLASTAGEPDTGSAILGWLCIGFVVWMIYQLFKPRGWDVSHRGETKIRPR